MDFLSSNYYIIIILTTLFFDREKRANRTSHNFRKEWIFNLFFLFLNIIGSIIIVSFYIWLVFTKGIGSKIMMTTGKLFGSITVLTVIFQYLPQFYTTCKIRDNGSFSLLLLAIQAPGGSISAIFMAIGQNDHWSTWASTLAASIQQFILLFLCLIFKYQRRRRHKHEVPLLSQISTSHSVDSSMLYKN